MRRIIPLLLVLLIAVPQAAFAGEWFRCRYDGETRSSCCCREGEHEESGSPSAEMRRTPCCDVLRNEPLAMSARAEGRGDIGLAMASTQAAVAPRSIDDAIVVAAEVSWMLAARATAPPRLGQPLYLSHSSLLL